MNLQTAIRERDYRLNRYLEAQKFVDKLAKKADEREKAMRNNRVLMKKEVAELCEVDPRTVRGWEADASTYLQWCDFLQEHISGKYLETFKRNYKK